MITPQELVNREVHYCVSSLVATLATAPLPGSPSAALFDLIDQAQELAAPIDDWEEAAIQAGWKYEADSARWFEDDTDDKEGSCLAYESAADLCRVEGIDPYEREVFEHWIVSDWLAEKLEAKGEKVDKDFAGMVVWARTTTGQAIYADGVIEQITKELNECA